MEGQNLTNHQFSQALSPTLRDFLAIGFRRRRLIFLSFLGIFLGAALCALLLPKRYEAEMKILVKRERVDPMVTPEPNAQPQLSLGQTEEQVNSEVELLKSRDLLEKVVIACGLQQRNGSFWASLFRDTRTGAADEAPEAGARIPQAVRTLEKQLQVEVLKRTNLIRVTYRSPDPELAARVLTTLAGFYLEKHLAVHRPLGAFDFFHQETEQYLKGLGAAEERLINFSRDQGVVSPQVEKQNTLLKLSEFDATLKQTQARIAGTEERIRALKAQAATTSPRLTTQLRTSDNPQLLEQLKSTLLTLEMKRTELLAKFEPGYRPVQEVETQIAQTRAAIAAAEKSPVHEETTDLDPTYEWMRAELAKSRTELADLQAQAAAEAKAVRAYHENARLLDQKEVVQQDLLRSVKATEENYLLYRRKQEEARISDALDQKRIGNVGIAEAATVPALPIHSPWWYVFLGGLLASVVSAGLAFATEYLDPSFRTPDEVQSFLNVPVLAAMPKNGMTNGARTYVS